MLFYWIGEKSNFSSRPFQAHQPTNHPHLPCIHPNESFFFFLSFIQWTVGAKTHGVEIPIDTEVSSLHSLLHAPHQPQLNLIHQCWLWEQDNWISCLAYAFRWSCFVCHSLQLQWLSEMLSYPDNFLHLCVIYEWKQFLQNQPGRRPETRKRIIIV